MPAISLIRFSARLCALFSLIAIFASSLFAAPTVTVLSPGNGKSAGSPLFYEAYATSPSCASGIAAMRIYSAPGVSAYTVNGAHIETFISLKPGSYNTVVQAWDNCGGVGKTAVNVNVNSLAAVSIFTPTGSAGNIPNHIAASVQSPSCAAGINAMRIYTANGVAPYTVHSNSLNTFVNLLPGTYQFTVQAWDNCGSVLKSQFTQTVSGSPAGYLYTVSAGTNSTIAQFNVNNGILTNPNGSGAPPQWKMTDAGFVAVDPGGWFIYVLSLNGIYAYQISQTNGALMPVSGSPFKTIGEYSDITIDPNGNFLFTCDKNLNSISVYSINRSSGALSNPTTIYGSANFNALAAVSTDFSGQYLYAVNQNYNSVQVFGYKINLDSGSLSAVPGSPYTVGNSVTPNTWYGFALAPVANYLYVGTQTGTGQAFGYTVNFGTGALTPIQSSAAWLIDGVPANPEALLADVQGRYLWAPGSSGSSQDWFTAYDILSGGSLGTYSQVNNGTLFSASIVADESGKYVYAQGYDQSCTSGSCPGVVTSYVTGANGALTKISGPLSNGGSSQTSLNQGIAVSSKNGY